jgi:hypothetical protein
MTATWPRARILILPVLLAALASISFAQPGSKPEAFWQVDDVRAGMKGQGRTVIKGTKIETFDAEVLGVLKNTSPGRDMILCRLSGLNLEKTGVIAGMSGSPIFIDGKLLGAVAYAWSYGKEPIAGVTPFSQMRNYAEVRERRDLVDKTPNNRVTLNTPLSVGGARYDAVTVSQDYSMPSGADPDGLWMMPLQTPLVATGFSSHCLDLLGKRVHAAGWLPMQGGGVPAQIADEEKTTPLEPGGPLAVALISGDFDLSGIGTVTQIEGQRVYGWGHPFFGLGACEFPLKTGYIHTVYPRQSVSFKMGSPLRTVGVINSDVSTCIAGWLDRKPDLIPMSIAITRESAVQPKTFHVDIVRQKSLVASLVYAALTNSVDMEGDLPEELTAELKATIDFEGHAPVVINDTFSGSSYSGGRAPQALYNQVALLVTLLTYNPYKPLRINRIDCTTQILSGRKTADIEAVELAAETVAPGDTLTANVYVRPYKGLRQRLTLALPLPADMPEGTYTANICDDLVCARADLRDNPNLGNPTNIDQVFDSVRVQTDVKRTRLVMRVPLSSVGVALEGKSLPDLPLSMVQILGNTRRTGAQPLTGALVARLNTDWVLQGSEAVRFTVSRNKNSLDAP